MVHFFERQCHDGHEASHLAVKLQKILCGIIFFYVLWAIVGFIFFAYAAGTPVLWFGFCGFAVIFFGFYGSYQKRLGLVNAFFFCGIIAVVFYTFVIIWYGIAAANLSACAANNCLSFDGIEAGVLRTAAALYVIELIISFFIWVLLIAALKVANHLRHELRHLAHHGHVGYSGSSVTVSYQQPQPQGYVPPPTYTQNYPQPQQAPPPSYYQGQPQQYQQPQYQQNYQQPPIVPLDPNNQQGYNRV